MYILHTRKCQPLTLDSNKDLIRSITKVTVELDWRSFLFVLTIGNNFWSVMQIVTTSRPSQRMPWCYFFKSKNKIHLAAIWILQPASLLKNCSPFHAKKANRIFDVTKLIVINCAGLWRTYVMQVIFTFI